MSLNKLALITGGTRGIGRATALALAAKSYDLALSYASSAKDFETTKALVDALGTGVRVAGFKADLGEADESKRVVDEVVAEFGKVDVLINNAALAVMKDVMHATPDDLDRTYALNQRAPFLLTQAAVPHIPKGGRVIFISSSLTGQSTIASPYAVYVPSKGAVEQMSRIFARTLAAEPYGILVNCISPGPTGTDLFYEGKSEELIKTIAAYSPFNRLGKPEEIAEVIAYFASSPTWIAGQNLRVNGALVV